jgi:hypothetical protein
MTSVSLLNKGLKPLVFKYLIFTCLLILFVFPLAAQDSGLSVDASQPVGAINPFVYGVNYGPWGLVPVDMWPMVETSGMTYLRFPAGNWGDQNDISESQLDLFITQAHQWHAEPHIHVRLLGGTPEKAAELVRYANIEKGYNVRYWSIGNEPNLFKNYTVDQFNKEWRPIAEAMLKVDPKIILTGPEVSQYPPTTSPSDYQAPLREWVRQFLKVNGDLVGLVSIHRYPFPLSMNSGAETDDQLRANPDEWDTIIPDLKAVIKDATGHDMPVAVTEVNSNWDNGASAPNTFIHAIWWADVLGRLIRQQVEIVNYFTLFTKDSNFGLLSRYDARPAYYVYQLYKQFGATLLTSTSTDKDVSITAALKDDGSLTLMVVNRANDAKTMPLLLKGFGPSEAAAVWLLDKDHKAENTGTADLSNGTVSLPAESVALYIIPASK